MLKAEEDKLFIISCNFNIRKRTCLILWMLFSQLLYLVLKVSVIIYIKTIIDRFIGTIQVFNPENVCVLYQNVTQIQHYYVTNSSMLTNTFVLYSNVYRHLRYQL